MSRKIFLTLALLMFVLAACQPAEPVEFSASPPPSTEVPAEPVEATEPAETLPPTEAPTAESYPSPTEAPTAESYPSPTEAPTVEPYPGPDAAETVGYCGGSSDVISFPLEIVDDMGNTITLEQYPQAIVSLSPSTTEILFAIGAGDQVAGRDDMSLYPEEALAVESIGSLWGELPTEAILTLEPDLVVAAQIISPENVQALQDLGLNVYWQSNPADFDGLYDNLCDFAVLTGHVDQTETLITDLQTRVDAVLTTVSAAESSPSVFYELDASQDPSNPWTTGSGTFIDYIITLAGGTNAAGALEGDFAQFSIEALITANPDVILLGDALYGVTPESVAERPGWDAIAAVQNEAIYPIDPNIMSVPGPRLVDGLEETARLLHPDLFE